MRTMLSTLILAVTLVGCGAAEMSFGGDGEGPWVDSDGDGLSDSEEEALKTDPMNEDTDGDGYSDGTENNSHTDPLDEEDHPYIGGWPIDSCRNDIEGSDSWAEGNIVSDTVTFTDQYGEQLKLHDFCNHVVLLEHAGFG